MILKNKQTRKASNEQLYGLTRRRRRPAAPSNKCRNLSLACQRRPTLLPGISQRTKKNIGSTVDVNWIGKSNDRFHPPNQNTHADRHMHTHTETAPITLSGRTVSQRRECGTRGESVELITGQVNQFLFVLHHLQLHHSDSPTADPAHFTSSARYYHHVAFTVPYGAEASKGKQSISLSLSLSDSKFRFHWFLRTEVI